MSLRYEQHYIQNPHVFGSLDKYSPNPNFHEKNKNPPGKLNNNFMLSQNQGPKAYQNLNLSNSVNQLPNQSKVSHARNFKQRLFQVDQLKQAKKEIQKMSYRQELEEQIKADKVRKIREKEKMEREELDRERKFYAEVGGRIKAQQPKPKQEPSYLILRSRKGDRNKQKTERNLESMDQSRSLNTKVAKSQIPEFHMPKIIKRGGYHNESSLDSMAIQQTKNQTLSQQLVINPLTSRISPVLNRSTQLQQRQLQLIKERNHEQQRISSIIKLQQKMIKKLQYFKNQIVKSNNHFNAEREVQQIRNILRSKPIKLEVWGVKNDQIFNNNNDFYQFPKADQRIMTRSRNRHNRSIINEGIDLNDQQQTDKQRTFTQQNQESKQNQEKNVQDQNPLTSRKRKRQIKLFKPANDKNYQWGAEENPENSEMTFPVVLRSQNKHNSYEGQIE